MLYANEFEIEGLIADKTVPGDYLVTGQEYEFDGVTAANSEIAQVFIDAYAEDYPNLLLHDPNYPSPEYLTSINVNGSIEYNDYEHDSDGSAIIKECILDDREDPLFIQCWGGTATLGAALRSIEEEYQDAEEWPDIQQKVYSKVIVWQDLGQDSCYDDYILPHWPSLNSIVSYSQYGAMVMVNGSNIPSSLNGYYAGDWVAQNITHGNSALSKAYYNITGMHKQGAADIVGYEDGLHAMAEGDTPNFFYIFDNGLRQMEDPSYGGWGGRYVKSSQPIGLINRIMQAPVNIWMDISDDGDIYKPIWRWTEDFQNDFAARMEWTYRPYEEANHAPSVWVEEGIDFEAMADDTITITAGTEDPDGDSVEVNFWQYDAADTFGGLVDLVPGEGTQVSFTVPEDARNNDTIHIIVEARDDTDHPMTRYQRVIVHVFDPDAPEPQW